MLWYPEALRRLQGQAAVPRGPGDQRATPTAACSSASRTRSRTRGPTSAPRRARPRTTTPGWPSTAVTRSSSTTATRVRREDRLGLQRSTTTTSTRSVRPSRAVSGRTTRSRSGPAVHDRAATATVIKEFENTPGKRVLPRRRPEHHAAPVRAGLHRPAEPRRRGPASSTATSASRTSRPAPAAWSRPKPFTVTGKGPHTLEVRSTDAAGHHGGQEDVRASRSAPRRLRATPATAARRRRSSRGPGPAGRSARSSRRWSSRRRPRASARSRRRSAARRSPSAAWPCRSPARARWTARRS